MLVGYADGCIDGCAAAGPNSFSALATIARQVNGPRLFAKYDVASAPSAPSLSGKNAGTSNDLTWTAPDDHGSAITSYKLYRKLAGQQLHAADVRCRHRDVVCRHRSDRRTVVRVPPDRGERERSVGCLQRRQPAPAAPAPDPCIAPGVQIMSDGPGDNTGGDPSQALQWVSVAEPPAIGPGNLEFIIKVADLSKPAANTTWPLQFKTADKADHFVKMETDALGKVTFGLGDGTATTSATTKPVDAQNSYAPIGTIRIVVARSALGIKPGDTLTAFLIRVSVRAVAISLTPDNAPNSLAPTGAYAVKGNENCSTPQAELAVGSGDLAVSGLKGAGNQQVIAAVVHNTGTATAPSVKLRFTVDGVQIGTVQTIGQIAAGATGRATVVWDMRGANGTHTITATADPANAIAERDESNNAGSHDIVVQGSKVALG